MQFSRTLRKEPHTIERKMLARPTRTLREILETNTPGKIQNSTQATITSQICRSIWKTSGWSNRSKCSTTSKGFSYFPLKAGSMITLVRSLSRWRSKSSTKPSKMSKNRKDNVNNLDGRCCQAIRWGQLRSPSQLHRPTIRLPIPLAGGRGLETLMNINQRTLLF